MSILSGIVGAIVSSAGKNSSKGNSSKGSSSKGNSGGGSSSNGYNDRVIKNNAGITNNVKDRELLSYYQKGYQNAKTQAEKDIYHAAAESLRNQYGYSGGVDGSQYIPTGSGGGKQNNYDYSGNNNYNNGGGEYDYNYEMPDFGSKEDFYEEYDAIARAQEEARRAQIEQGVNSLNSQKSGINQSYDDIAKQAYINKRMAEVAMPQQLAAVGVSGGAAESTNLGMQTNYQNNLNQNETQRTNQLQNIDNSITDLKLSGDASIADIQAKANIAALEAYQKQISQQMDAYKWQNDYNMQKNKLDFEKEQAEANNEFNRNKYNYSVNKDKEDSEYNKNYNIAKLLADSGDFSGFERLGVNTAAMKKQWEYELEKSSKSNVKPAQSAVSVSQKSTTSKPRSAYNTVDNYNNNAITKTEVTDKNKKYTVNDMTPEKLEMIKRWWTSSRNKNEFYNTVNNAMNKNLLDRQDIQAWLDYIA